MCLTIASVSICNFVLNLNMVVIFTNLLTWLELNMLIEEKKKSFYTITKVIGHKALKPLTTHGTIDNAFTSYCSLINVYKTHLEFMTKRVFFTPITNSGQLFYLTIHTSIPSISSYFKSRGPHILVKSMRQGDILEGWEA